MGRNRTPNPPTAQEKLANGGGSRRARLSHLITGIAIVARAIGVGIVLSRGDNEERAALKDAGCTLEGFPAQQNEPDHSDVPTLTTKPNWNSNPPTSGPHYREWAVWGFYEDPVPLVKSVHNLEHGGVVIHYGPRVTQAELEQLRNFYNSDPNGTLVAPLGSNGNNITLTAWTAPNAEPGTIDRGRGWLARCPTFASDAFFAFIHAHRYRGPERLLPEQLAPGS